MKAALFDAAVTSRHDQSRQNYGDRKVEKGFSADDCVARNFGSVQRHVGRDWRTVIWGLLPTDAEPSGSLSQTGRQRGRYISSGAGSGHGIRSREEMQSRGG